MNAFTEEQHIICALQWRVGNLRGHRSQNLWLFAVGFFDILIEGLMSECEEL